MAWGCISLQKIHKACPLAHTCCLKMVSCLNRSTWRWQCWSWRQMLTASREERVQRNHLACLHKHRDLRGCGETGSLPEPLVPAQVLPRGKESIRRKAGPHANNVLLLAWPLSCHTPYCRWTERWAAVGWEFTSQWLPRWGKKGQQKHTTAKPQPSFQVSCSHAPPWGRPWPEHISPSTSQTPVLVTRYS